MSALPAIHHLQPQLTQQAPLAPALPPLVCDLDGTLCRTDTLHELILRALATSPLTLLHALFLLLTQGRLAFKLCLAERITLDPALLPYNTAVLSALKEARACGRPVVLATASAQSLANSLAAHLGLFDAVYGSTPEHNLKGTEKAALLISLYGKQGFDYIGDSKADRPLFETARCAYLASPRDNTLTPLSTSRSDPDAQTPSSSKISSEKSIPLQTFSQGDGSKGESVSSSAFAQGEGLGGGKVPPPTTFPLIKGVRVHQWAKNALLFAPLLLAHDFSSKALIASFTAFMIFCAAASAGYIVNDCLDLSADRAHPVKRHRPFACGALSPLPWFTVAALSQLALPFVAVFMLPLPFALCLACYIVLNLCYSLKLKRLLFVDVLVLTSLYVLRVVAGATAISSPLSAWVMLCSCFAFLTLALVKRLTELSRSADAAALQPGSVLYGRAYLPADRLILSALAAASACSTVFTLILYAFEDAARHHYATPALIAFTALPVFFAFGRLLLLACRGSLRYDPVIFVLRDAQSLCCALSCFVIYLCASYYQGAL